MIVKSAQGSISVLSSQVSKSAFLLICLAGEPYPVLRVEIQILHLSMLEETCQSNPIICQVRFFSNNHNIVLASFCVHFKEFLSKQMIIISITSIPYDEPWVEIESGVRSSHERNSYHPQSHYNNFFPL